MRTIINVNDFAKIEAKLAFEKGREGYEALRDTYEGPDTGVDYDEETGKLSIAAGWTTDKHGNVVRKDEVTGPGVEG